MRRTDLGNYHGHSEWHMSTSCSLIEYRNFIAVNTYSFKWPFLQKGISKEVGFVEMERDLNLEYMMLYPIHQPHQTSI